MKGNYYGFMRTFILVLGGGVLGWLFGQFLGLSWQDGVIGGPTILIPIIVSGVNGILIDYYSRHTNKSIAYYLLAFLGLTAGLYLGAAFEGMFGTLLSFPFPQNYFPPIHLFGIVVGMLAIGTALPLFLIRRFAK